MTATPDVDATKIAKAAAATNVTLVEVAVRQEGRVRDLAEQLAAALAGYSVAYQAVHKAWGADQTAAFGLRSPTALAADAKPPGLMTSRRSRRRV
ncbi:hypothetical protein Lfu02_75630 [Longispora fulva]|nr:hypothetical protein Lfu02_75630 [Longispora fulva]